MSARSRRTTAFPFQADWFYRRCPRLNTAMPIRVPRAAPTSTPIAAVIKPYCAVETMPLPAYFVADCFSAAATRRRAASHRALSRSPSGFPAWLHPSHNIDTVIVSHNARKHYGSHGQAFFIILFIIINLCNLSRNISFLTNKYPPAKPGVFHMRAQPSHPSVHVERVIRSANCMEIVTCCP